VVSLRSVRRYADQTSEGRQIGTKNQQVTDHSVHLGKKPSTRGKKTNSESKRGGKIQKGDTSISNKLITQWGHQQCTSKARRDCIKGLRRGNRDSLETSFIETHNRPKKAPRKDGVPKVVLKLANNQLEGEITCWEVSRRK